jgi:hypothetical protein
MQSLRDSGALLLNIIMKTFLDFFLVLEADPLANISSPASMPGGPMPPGGGMPPPPMGGGMGGMMPPMGGGGMPPPMGGPPMGGGMAPPATPPVNLKPITVWSVVEKILNGKGDELDKEEKPKQPGQQQNNMLASGQPSQLPPQLPSDPMSQGMPAGQPPMPGMPTM